MNMNVIYDCTSTARASSRIIIYLGGGGGGVQLSKYMGVCSMPTPRGRGLRGLPSKKILKC